MSVAVAVLVLAAAIFVTFLFVRLRRLQRVTREREERFALALAGANDGIWDWDLRTDRLYLSARLREILDYGAADGYATLPRLALRRRLHPDERPRVLAGIEDYLGGVGGELFETECRWRRGGGEYRWVLIRGKALRDANGRAVRMSGSVSDIDQRKRQEQALLHRTLHDPATGLPNRTLLEDRLEQAIRAAARSGRSLALIALDLDNFREINDTLGRRVGDDLLKEVGARLSRTLRSSDTVARPGGDEFAILLPDIAGEAYADQVAKKLAVAMSRAFDLEQHALHVGATLGIALYPQHGEDPDTLLRHANVALCSARRRGSVCAVYDSEQDRGGVRRLALANDLHQALERDALSVHFQPVIDLRVGVVTGVEALLRWQHPVQGPIRPEEIVPIAERSGLIKALTLWILDVALQQQAEWECQGLTLRVAVNLSVWSLQEPRLIQDIEEALSRWGVPAGHLELEITESGMMADARRSLEVLTQLSEMGVRLAIDDYGTGFSSLAYLKRLPVDTLKIDKSFVMTMDRDEEDAAIVRSTVELAHTLGLTVVAEGVESKTIADRLVALGCDMAQGYHFCRPTAPGALTQWLRLSPWNGSGRQVSA